MYIRTDPDVWEAVHSHRSLLGFSLDFPGDFARVLHFPYLGEFAVIVNVPYFLIKKSIFDCCTGFPILDFFGGFHTQNNSVNIVI